METDTFSVYFFFETILSVPKVNAEAIFVRVLCCIIFLVDVELLFMMCFGLEFRDAYNLGWSA